MQLRPRQRIHHIKGGCRARHVEFGSHDGDAPEKGGGGGGGGGAGEASGQARGLREWRHGTTAGAAVRPCCQHARVLLRPAGAAALPPRTASRRAPRAAAARSRHSRRCRTTAHKRLVEGRKGCGVVWCGVVGCGVHLRTTQQAPPLDRF